MFITKGRKLVNIDSLQLEKNISGYEKVFLDICFHKEIGFRTVSRTIAAQKHNIILRHLSALALINIQSKLMARSGRFAGTGQSEQKHAITF